MARYVNVEEYLKRLCEVEYQMDRQSNKPITAMIAKNVFMLVRDELRGMPTADVREVILCKDCKYITEHYDTDGNAPYWTCSEWDSETDYDGFCHYAERRGGE